MKKLLFVLTLLPVIWILLIVNPAFFHAQGYRLLWQPSLYLGQFIYPWTSQGFIPNYASQNTLTNQLWPDYQIYASSPGSIYSLNNQNNQLWSYPQYFSQGRQGGVYPSLGFSSTSASSALSTSLLVYGLNLINYYLTFQTDQSFVPSSIPYSISPNNSAPFTNLSLSNYYLQDLESPSYSYTSYTSNTYSYTNFSLKNPYSAKGTSYKGQIHCHTTNSDGADSPADLVTAYKNAGYGFIIVTDHDTVTPSPSVPGIRFIQGCEETALTGHIGRLSCLTQTPDLNAQTILNTIQADGGISVLNHPWGSADYENDWTIQEIERLNGYKAIEIFNGSQQAREHNAEKQWDSVLSRSLFVTGVAADDCHNIAGSGFNQGWIVVYADTNSEAEIIKGIRTGNFYSSSGPDLRLSVSSSTISATTGLSSTIAFIGKNGQIIQRNLSTTIASYTVKGWEGYIRVKVTRDLDGECAWSNPVMVER